jgi:acyl carrier protein
MKTDRETLLKEVLQRLSAIAPELETDAMKPDRPLRHLVDLDSMDWLNFLVSLHEHYGVVIAESDYAKLVTLNDVVDYLQKKRV